MDKEKGKIFSSRLLKWFSTNARDFPWRKESNPYRILVAEKLLQQTTYGHVLKVYDDFLNKFPDAYTLSEAKVSDIEETIRRIGFQNQRAKQFKEIGLTLVSEHNGEIPSNKSDLLGLKGVGEYVASAVLCFAFGKDNPVVDVNVRRVVRRYFGWKRVRNGEIARRLEKLITKGQGRKFNLAVIDFSSLICSRKPKCEKCFLSDQCLFYQAKSSK